MRIQRSVVRYTDKMYTVYILECADGSLYTGITTDMEKRLAAHAAGTASKYTRARGVRAVRYQEQQPNRSTASQREAAIKQLTTAQKHALIALTASSE